MDIHYEGAGGASQRAAPPFSAKIRFNTQNNILSFIVSSQWFNYNYWGQIVDIQCREGGTASEPFKGAGLWSSNSNSIWRSPFNSTTPWAWLDQISRFNLEYCRSASLIVLVCKRHIYVHKDFYSVWHNISPSMMQRKGQGFRPTRFPIKVCDMSIPHTNESYWIRHSYVLRPQLMLPIISVEPANSRGPSRASRDTGVLPGLGP
jgi:hypothetical protein